jgi:hypothetical protein
MPINVYTSTKQDIGFDDNSNLEDEIHAWSSRRLAGAGPLMRIRDSVGQEIDLYSEEEVARYPDAPVMIMYNQSGNGNHAMTERSHADMRNQLEQIERQLIPLLRSIQAALGKATEPTREERRKLKTK